MKFSIKKPACCHFVFDELFNLHIFAMVDVFEPSQFLLKGTDLHQLLFTKVI